MLKRSENLKYEQYFRLRDLLRHNLKTVRAYLLKEAFQQLWDYNSPAWAGKFLDEWCRQTMRSRIEPMKKIARSLRQHRELKSINGGLTKTLNRHTLHFGGEWRRQIAAYGQEAGNAN